LNYAFNGCTGITAIGIQKSAAAYALSIGTAAFQSCANLIKIAFIEDAVEIPSLSLGTNAFAGCANLADFTGVDANSIIINAIGGYAFDYARSLNYNMLDKIQSITGATKVQDAVNKKYIYFKPDNNAVMYTKGNLIYGEIES
jgi:hypothetical protein